MPLEPGPVQFAPDADYALTPEEPEFQAAQQEDLAAIDSVDAELTTLISELSEVTTSEDAVALEYVLAEPIDELASVTETPLASIIEEVSPAVEEIDALDHDAYNEVPAESWQPVPAPYYPPEDSTYFVETPESGREQAPARVAPTVAQGQVVIHNLGKGTDPAYYVGDPWYLQLQAFGSSPVEVTGTHNAEVFYPNVVGYTSPSGYFELRGVMTENELGHWVQTWSVGGMALRPVLEFDVLV